MPDTHVVTIDGEQFIVYDSENTGQQLDAGIRKLAGLDADIQAAAEAAAAAEASKQAAASSQTAAAASASTAQAQASTATSKASEAASSASAALQSKNAAASSATAAENSKNAAATSASNAAASAGAAADSEEAAENSADAAAASAQDAEDAADRAAIESQKALGFRSYYGGQVVPDTNGDLDPSRPMSTPTAASVTIKARGDRIAGLTMAGKTTQAGTGDPSPENIRPISGVGMYDKCVVLDGSEAERWYVFQGVPGVFSHDFTPRADNANHIKTNSKKYNPSDDISTLKIDEFATQRLTNYTRFILRYDSLSTDPKDIKDYLSAHPLTVWYRSVNYTKSTGPFYTVVELSQDPYRAVGFELNQPLFDGDSLKVGGLSGFDKMVVYDGSVDEGWRTQNAAKGQYRIPSPQNSTWSYPDRRTTMSSYLKPIEPLFVYLENGSFFISPSKSVSSSGEDILAVCIASCTNLTDFRDYLAAHPLTIFYKSVNYTPENDIPVAIERHTGNYLIFDGTETVTATTVGSNTPYLQIAGVADNHNSSHRLVSSVAPFFYAYGGAGAFADYDNIVFGKAWCQSNGFANTETMVKDFKSFLTAQHTAGTPVQVVYELATPVSYARPVPTMIAQPGEDGTFTVTGENSLSVLLKAFQDGGDAATIEGHTWADILAAIQAATASTANALLEEKTNV